MTHPKDEAAEVTPQAANRAAVLTPPGPGAIAVVRISGPAVAAFLQRHFTAKPAGNRCVHGTLHDGERIIDDPVIVLRANGNTADINLHGGEWVVRECVELAQRNGFAIVQNLPDAAHDLIEQEMLAALPLARTELAIRTLLAQPGAWSQFQKDFNTHGRSAMQHRIGHMLADQSLWWLINPPSIAIVGIANVGKSTLANQLFGQERSITADIPGTTRDYVGDWAQLDGLPIHLLDTPGIRDSTDTIEQAAIARSRGEIERADLVIVVLDPTQHAEPQRRLLDQFPQAMRVINKSDLPAVADFSELNALHTVATSGTGVEALSREIRAGFITTNLNQHPPRWWTRRQQSLLLQ